MQDFIGMPMKDLPLEDAIVDSMLWSGLMAASGDFSAARGIRASQDGSGRLWRSPVHMVSKGDNSFSRDMALGFLLYIASSRDMPTFYSWLRYLEEHGELCDNADDGRCYITPPIWWQIMRVAGTLNSQTTPWYLWTYLYFSAKTAPVGYQLHLVGCHLLLNWLLSREKDLRIARILNKRQPKNPFFQWLADMPVVLPDEPKASNCSQWAWEREDSEEAWRDAMGWDFLFIRNLVK